MHFYSKNIGDFNSATRHLTRVERSLYSDAIELYYETEKPLTLDLIKLERHLLAKTDEEKAALKAVLDEFFIASNDGYRNKRCDEEIQKYKNNINNKVIAGKASAAKRFKKEFETKDEQQDNTSSTAVEQPLLNYKTNKLINNKKNKQKKIPIPPSSFDEVKEYFQEKKLISDPLSFFNYFDAGDWYDRDGNPVISWKQRAQTWNTREKSWSSKSSQPDKQTQTERVRKIL